MSHHVGHLGKQMIVCITSGLSKTVNGTPDGPKTRKDDYVHRTYWLEPNLESPNLDLKVLIKILAGICTGFVPVSSGSLARMFVRFGIWIVQRQTKSFPEILWMDEILHQLRHPGMFFPLQTPANNGFPIVSKWCRISSIHSISQSGRDCDPPITAADNWS